MSGNRVNDGWLVSPPFDLAFFCNLPAIFLLLPSQDINPLEFCQIHFLTMPHRWLTIAAIVTDRDRRQGLSLAALAGIAVFFGALVSGTWAATGDLTCLLLLDYIWNGWHFASQHSGIMAVYSRRCQDTRRMKMERLLTRAVVFYAIIRTAGWSTGWMETSARATLVMEMADFLSLFLGLCLVARILACRPIPVAKACYAASVILTYSLLLVGLMLDSKWLVGSMAVASALFHATEYMAFFSYYAWRRREIGTNDAFRAMAQNWTVFLSLFCLALGAMSVLLQHGEAMPRWWLAMNICVAFLHYSYDGLIWKLRIPATAKALGVGS